MTKFETLSQKISRVKSLQNLYEIKKEIKDTELSEDDSHLLNTQIKRKRKFIKNRYNQWDIFVQKSINGCIKIPRASEYCSSLIFVGEFLYSVNNTWDRNILNLK